MADVLSAPVDRLKQMGEAGAARVRTSHDARAEGRQLLDHIQAIDAVQTEP
jgi:hypothetical protein